MSAELQSINSQATSGEIEATCELVNSGSLDAGSTEIVPETQGPFPSAPVFVEPPIRSSLLQPAAPVKRPSTQTSPGWACISTYKVIPDRATTSTRAGVARMRLVPNSRLSFNLPNSRQSASNLWGHPLAASTTTPTP